MEDRFVKIETKLEVHSNKLREHDKQIQDVLDIRIENGDGKKLNLQEAVQELYNATAFVRDFNALHKLMCKYKLYKRVGIPLAVIIVMALMGFPLFTIIKALLKLAGIPI